MIDLYPTICDLADVPKPQMLDGKSLVPMLRDPSTEGKPYAIGRYKLGDTIRTKAFRYTEFRGKVGDRKVKGPVGMEKIMGRMIFSRSSDPDENNNVVKEERFADVAKQLSAELNANKGKPSKIGTPAITAATHSFALLRFGLAFR